MSHKPKNTIVMLSDQHRWDAMQMVDPRVKTPNLQRMADAGTMFDHCYCVAQACVPSRASLMTGKYLDEHLVRNNQHKLHRNEKTWASYLSDQGVQTVAVGRTHHIDLGFDNVIRVPSGKSYPVNCHDPSLQKHWTPEAYVGPSEVPFEEYYEHKITQTAMDFLEEMVRSQEPFTLYVGFLAPHAALTPPEPFWSMYKDLQVTLPDPGDISPPIKNIIQQLGFDQVTEALYQRLVRGYYAMVSMMDACVGMLLDKVQQMGIEQDTVMIYLSDHGEMLGHKGLHCKGYGYDPSIRIPLIATCPGTIPSQRRVDAMVEHIDIGPTICEALGLKAMPCSGQSVWNVMTGKTAQHRDYIFSAVGNSMQLLRNKQYKWIRYADSHTHELYDMQKDPLEQNDLSKTPQGQKIIAQMSLELLDFNITHHNAQVTDFDSTATQPKLIPYFTA